MVRFLFLAGFKFVLMECEIQNVTAEGNGASNGQKSCDYNVIKIHLLVLSLLVFYWWTAGGVPLSTSQCSANEERHHVYVNIDS